MFSKLNIGQTSWNEVYDSKEWVRLDFVMNDCINVCANMLTMPFLDNTFKEVHCIHVLEHLTREKHILALKEIYRVLKPNGKCYIEVPDFKETVKLLNTAFNDNDEKAIHIWTTSVYGKTERKGMAHHFGFHEAKLLDLFRRSSFTNVKRESVMISEHHLQEPVLLVSGEK